MIICSSLQKLTSRVGQGWGSRSSVIWGGSHISSEGSLLLHSVIEEATVVSDKKTSRLTERCRTETCLHSIFFCHLCVSLTASSLVIRMCVLLPFPRRWSLNLWQSPHIAACLPSSPFFCCAFFKSTGDALKGHVYRSSQHLASALACSSLLLLATEAGTTATKRVRHSPQRCGRSSDSQAKLCPGFTAWRSTLEYTLTSLCQPNYIWRKWASLPFRPHDASLLRGLFIHLLSGSEAFLEGAAQQCLSPSFREDTAPVMARITLSSIVTVVCLSPSGSERQFRLVPWVSSVTTPAEQPVYCISAGKKKSGLGFLECVL